MIKYNYHLQINRTLTYTMNAFPPPFQSSKIHRVKKIVLFLILSLVLRSVLARECHFRIDTSFSHMAQSCKDRIMGHFGSSTYSTKRPFYNKKD